MVKIVGYNIWWVIALDVWTRLGAGKVRPIILDSGTQTGIIGYTI